MYVLQEVQTRRHDPIYSRYNRTTTGINKDEDISQSLRLMNSWCLNMMIALSPTVIDRN